MEGSIVVTVLLTVVSLVYGLTSEVHCLAFLTLLYFNSFLDIAYGVRVFAEVLFSTFQGRTALLKPFVYKSIVLPSDLDVFMHMNNARYSRETDFARAKIALSSGLYSYLWRRKCQLIVATSAVRFRKVLGICSRFDIQSQVIYWDKSAFYLKHSFVDGKAFICAVQYVKWTITPKDTVCPSSIIAALNGSNVECPPCPDDLKLLIELNELSSRNLRG